MGIHSKELADLISWMKPCLQTMRYRVLVLILAGLISFIQPQNCLRASAQVAPLAASEASEHVAVILILDNSGSMGSNDPEKLRYTAARLFISLLDEGDAVGVIQFSTTSRALTSGLIALRRPADQQALMAAIPSADPEHYTDMKAAFLDAQAMLKQAESELEGRRTFVVFLTDGKPEIAKPYQAYEQETLDAARQLAAPVLSIPLTGGGDTPFLKRLTVETQGRIFPARDASELLDAYLQILGDLKDRTVLGSEVSSIPGTADLYLDPGLAPYVDRAIFVAGKPETATVNLLMPDGQNLQAAQSAGGTVMADDPGFLMISVTKPQSGMWQFQFSGSGRARGRAILFSRLRARLVAPGGVVEAGQPMSIVTRLIEAQPDRPTVNIIGQASFSALITRPDGVLDSLDQFYDDGTHGDARAGDGEFTRVYSNTVSQGNYLIHIQGRKGGAPAEYTTQVQAVAFPALIVERPSQPRYAVRQQPIDLSLLLEGADPEALQSGSFLAHLTLPSGQVLQVMLVADGIRYHGQFKASEDGAYQVDFIPKEVYYSGLPFRHTTSARFLVQHVPTVTVHPARLMVEEPYLSSKKIELATARAGLLLSASASSSAKSELDLSAHLENMPGLHLQPPTTFRLAPGQDQPINLHLQADPQVLPGQLSGRLVFTITASTQLPPSTGSEGAAAEIPEGVLEVDLLGGQSSLAFELFQPHIQAAAWVTSQATTARCWEWAPPGIHLAITSTSLVTEQLDLRLDNLADVNLNPQQISVPPGVSQVVINLIPSSGRLNWGSHAPRLTLISKRSDSQSITLSPGNPLSIPFQVDPPWVTCRPQLQTCGIALFAGLIGLWLLGTIFRFIVSRRLNVDE